MYSQARNFAPMKNSQVLYTCTVLSAFLASRLWPEYRFSEHNYYLYFLAVLLYLASFKFFLRGLYASRHRFRTKQAKYKTSAKYGSAQFATVKQCKKAKLLTPAIGGLFLGALHGHPIFNNTVASSQLTVAPSQTGKSTSAAIPALLHNLDINMVVADPKLELTYVTAKHRQSHGHKIICLNPYKAPGLPNHCFNPLAILVEYNKSSQTRLLMEDTAKEIALQLIEESSNNQQHKIFRSGGRRILIAIVLHLATFDPNRCNLTTVWEIVNDLNILYKTLEDMYGNSALNGGIQKMASGLTSTLKDNGELFNSFLENAVEGISPFSSMGVLCHSTSRSDFSFEELKKNQRITIYICVPPEFQKTAKEWLGLVTQAAIRDVSRTRGFQEVLFLLDEFTNMRIDISEALTLLPALGCRVWIFVQAISEIVRVYGPEVTDTILSQCKVKQFFGFQDHKFCKETAEMLGQMTVKTEQDNIDNWQESITFGYGETGRPMMTPDQLRMLGDRQQLLFIDNAPAILADRIPYFDVLPWRGWAAPNPTVRFKEMPDINPKYKLEFEYR